MSKGTNERSIGLDILRIFAALMIVIQHVSSYGLDGFQVGTMGWRASNFYCAGVRWAVPLFFVMSGHLFLNRDKEFSVLGIFKKNLTKLIVVYFVWLFFYSAISTDFSGRDLANGITAIAKEALNNGKYHLWFLPSMIGCYMMLPVFYALAEYKDGKYLRCVCLMFVIMGIGRSTIFPFQDNLLSLAAWKIDFPMAGYLGYFLLGCYLGRLDVTKYRTRYLIVALLLTLAIHVISCDCLGVRSGLLYGNFCLLTFAEVVILFFLARKVRIVTLPDVAKKIIIVCSEGTLGVYLIHIYVLERMQQLTIYSFTQWLSIPAVSLTIFGISMCVSVILRRIPLIGKWIV